MSARLRAPIDEKPDTFAKGKNYEYCLYIKQKTSTLQKQQLLNNLTSDSLLTIYPKKLLIFPYHLF